MKWITLLAILAVSYCCPRPALSEPKTYRAKGCTLRVDLVPEKTTIVLGEPVFISLRVRNLSKANVQVIIGKENIPESSNLHRFIFTARSDSGIVVEPPPLPTHYTGPIDNLVGPNLIAAGKIYSFERFLPQELKITGPGKYTVRCRKRMEIVSPPADGGWDQKQRPDMIDTDTTAVINILPPDPKRLGQVIDQFGRTMTAANPDEGGTYDSATHAATVLNAINDARVIPWFIKQLQLRNSGYKEYALGALAKYDSAIAYKAIQSGFETRGADLRDWNSPKQRDEAAESVRLEAARALSNSPYRGALPALFAHKNDRNEYIRLQIVHAAGRQRTAEADAVLTELSHDTSSLVRDEAARYLGLRRKDPSK